MKENLGFIFILLSLLGMVLYLRHPIRKHEKDLIIGDEDDEDSDLEGEVEWDETTACAYVDTAMNVWFSLEDVDTLLMSKADAKRINNMKRKSLRIAAHYIDDIYSDIFDTKDEDEG